MGVTETVTRLLRRYGLVLVLAIALPVVAVGAYVVRQPANYTAHARVVAADSIPRSQAEATAVVSQVQALATSRGVVTQALEGAHLARDTDKVIKATTVTGLGSSSLVDIGYTDHDREMAQKVTGAIASAVVAQLDAARIGSLPEVLKDIDNQLVALAAKRAPIAADAQANPHDPVAQNKLASMDSLISSLTADRIRLAQDAGAVGRSTVVAQPVPPAHADSRGLPAMLVVAGLLGLVIGLIIVGINETVRPSVAGAPQLARLLDVPTLGTVGSDPVRLADIGRRIRLAARRAGVSTVVLARASRDPLPPELVDRIAAATLRPDAVAGRMGVPIDLDDDFLGVPGRERFAGRPKGDNKRYPDGHASAGVGTDAETGSGWGTGSVALLGAAEGGARPDRLREVIALDELEPGAEAQRIGLVVLASVSNRLPEVEGVRDLAAASGWPVLGVLGEGRDRQEGTR